MANRTKSFPSCVSVLCALSFGACELNDEQTARFSEASSSEISSVLTAVTLVEYAWILVPTIATLDSVFSQNKCPEVTATSIIGNGCEIPGGGRYDGSVEIGSTVVGTFTSMTFHEFRRTEPNLRSLYLDGNLAFAQKSGEELRYELDLIFETQAGFAANVHQIDIEASATCRVLGEASARCTMGAGSAAHVSNVGGFTIEGTHSVGAASDSPEASTHLDMTLHGAETMHVVYDAASGCMQYTIDDDEPLERCLR